MKPPEKGGFDEECSSFAPKRSTIICNETPLNRGFRYAVMHSSGPWGGGGSSPSIGSRTAYTTRDEAIAAGINELIATFRACATGMDMLAYER